MSQSTKSIICIGAGPAGLTAARHLARAGCQVRVLEQDPQHVGGISRTEQYKGYRFDVGGHRFFSRSPEIVRLWEEILGPELIQRPRKSRIFYQGKLFNYPLSPFDALSKLGLLEAIRCGASYLRARMLPLKDPHSFEDWVVNQFGRRLFEIFFQTYTEKVWGMKCSEISADWAAQRIKGLSLGRAISQAFTPAFLRRAADGPKSLIESFTYPRLGPGQMWEAAAAQVQEAGGEVLLGHTVTGIERDGASGGWVVHATSAAGAVSFSCEHVLSSIAIADLARCFREPPPEPVLTAATSLRYREFISVALMVRDIDCFDDNWIYIHEAGVRVGRIQNFKSWSPYMVPVPGMNCLGMEYFCFQGDGLWESSDEALIRLADEELVQLGLVTAGHVVDGKVIRQPKAYPVYDENYECRVQLFRDWVTRACPGLHLVGRNGMHKYNNQDHAMMTALLSAENILAGEQRWDVWRVNEDAEYHELGEDRSLAFTERLVPRQLPLAAGDQP